MKGFLLNHGLPLLICWMTLTGQYWILGAHPVIAMLLGFLVIVVVSVINHWHQLRPSVTDWWTSQRRRRR